MRADLHLKQMRRWVGGCGGRVGGSCRSFPIILACDQRPSSTDEVFDARKNHHHHSADHQQHPCSQGVSPCGSSSSPKTSKADSRTQVWPYRWHHRIVISLARSLAHFQFPRFSWFRGQWFQTWAAIGEQCRRVQTLLSLFLY